MNCDYFNIILAIIIALIPVVTATITLTQHLQRLGGGLRMFLPTGSGPGFG